MVQPNSSEKMPLHRTKLRLKSMGCQSLGLRFIRAVKKGNVDPVRRILEEGKSDDSFDVNGIFGNGKNTALHKAASQGHIEMVKLLLANGANPTIKNRKQDTAVMLGLKSMILFSRNWASNKEAETCYTSFNKLLNMDRSSSDPVITKEAFVLLYYQLLRLDNPNVSLTGMNRDASGGIVTTIIENNIGLLGAQNSSFHKELRTVYESIKSAYGADLTPVTYSKWGIEGHSFGTKSEQKDDKVMVSVFNRGLGSKHHKQVKGGKVALSVSYCLSLSYYKTVVLRLRSDGYKKMDDFYNDLEKNGKRVTKKGPYVSQQDTVSCATLVLDAFIQDQCYEHYEGDAQQEKKAGSLYLFSRCRDLISFIDVLEKIISRTDNGNIQKMFRSHLDYAKQKLQNRFVKAVKQADIELVRYLLPYIEDVSCPNVYGKTALLEAMEHHLYDTIDLLERKDYDHVHNFDIKQIKLTIQQKLRTLKNKKSRYCSPYYGQYFVIQGQEEKLAVLTKKIRRYKRTLRSINRQQRARFCS